MDLVKELGNNLIGWGASRFGFSNVSDRLPQNLKKLEYAITVVVRLSDFIIDEIGDCPTYTYFHHYRTVNTLIDQISLKGLLMLQDKGYKALRFLPPRRLTMLPISTVEYSPTRQRQYCPDWVGSGKTGCL